MRNYSFVSAVKLGTANGGEKNASRKYNGVVSEKLL
jgi:hypothetical protein